jgi:hypothetical protein
MQAHVVKDAGLHDCMALPGCAMFGSARRDGLPRWRGTLAAPAVRAAAAVDTTLITCAIDTPSARWRSIDSLSARGSAPRCPAGAARSGRDVLGRWRPLDTMRVCRQLLLAPGIINSRGGESPWSDRSAQQNASGDSCAGLAIHRLLDAGCSGALDARSHRDIKRGRRHSRTGTRGTVGHDRAAMDRP